MKNKPVLHIVVPKEWVEGKNWVEQTILQIDPMVPHQDSVPFILTVAENTYGPWQPNRVAMWGFVNAGGGPPKDGQPGVGFSIEHNYRPEIDASLTECHEFWVDLNGKQHRVKSWTADNKKHDIDFFHTVSRFYLKYPGQGDGPENEYFRISPGEFKLPGVDPVLWIGGCVIQFVTSWNALQVNSGMIVGGADKWGWGLTVRQNASIGGRLEVGEVDVMKTINDMKKQISTLERKVSALESKFGIVTE